MTEASLIPTLPNVDAYLREFLKIDDFTAADPSLNGLQVKPPSLGGDGKPLTRIAFAVDACRATFERAVQSGAELLVVHHGLFWGAPQPVRGVLAERLAYLLERGLGLYAAHLPLDQHPWLGNNALLGDLLGISAREPFGLYHGKKIGWKGALAAPLTLDEAAARIAFQGRPPLALLPFGKDKNETCAVVSGGASEEAFQALDEGIDLFVTGECSHTVYHHAQEGRLNILAGGHYATEVWGVRRLRDECARRFPGIETLFIDVPTGL